MHQDRYKFRERLMKKAEKLARERIRYRQLQSKVVRFLVEDASDALKHLRSEGYSESEIVRTMNWLIKELKKEEPSAIDFERVSIHHIKRAFEIIDSKQRQRGSRKKQPEQSKQPKKFSFLADEEDRPEIVKLHEQRRPKKF